MEFEEPETCPVWRALGAVGDRWSVLIMRDLLLNDTRRFQDLQLSLKGIAPNTLSARLKSLESAGMITTKLYSAHPPRAEYLLTEKGRSFGNVMLALRDWGTKFC